MAREPDVEADQLVALRDEVARLRAELASLRNRSTIVDQTLDRAPVAIQIFGPEGLSLRMNEAQRAFLGVPSTEFGVGRFNVLTDPFSVNNGSAATFQRVYDGEIVEIPELWVEFSDAEERWQAMGGRRAFEQLIFPVKDECGQVLAAVSLIRDITERKRMEQALIESQRQESLGLLAGGIAHDFNNLLVGMMGNASLALLDLPPASPARDALERVRLAAERAAELTRQMLAYSGKGRFVVEPIHLSRVVEEMAQLLQVTFSGSTHLRLELCDPLPSIEADAAQIRQVVMNLITNAADAIGDAPGSITLGSGVVEADEAYLASGFQGAHLEPGRYVFLEVSDSGRGMDPATTAQMFEPFFSTKPTGHGLGLAATLGIVRGHGGAIRVYSEPGKGTTIKLLFPVCGAEVQPGAPDLLEEGRTRGGTVLVVDDDPVVRQFTSAALERGECEILLAADGPTALRIFEANAGRIDLVLLDLTMPGMSGQEVFARLRRLDPEVRVVLSSGYNEQEATSRFVGKGLAGFLQKPYRVQDLLGIVSSQVGTRRGRA